MANLNAQITKWLAEADIKINGSRSWDIQVNNDKLFDRVMKKGSLGLGEAYMEHWWDAEALDEFFYHILSAELEKKVSTTFPALWNVAKAWLKNQQNESHAFEVGNHHYDTGNDLFKVMLDKNMVYTCGYWQDVDTLDEAQEKKLNTVCRKAGLCEGQRVLDIGCGWGSFAKYAASNFGVEVIGLTVSKEQQKLARKRCKGLPVEIRLEDYRQMNQQFDHIVSLGMFEHVGVKNYRTYMNVVSRCLSPKGTFVLHTIGGNSSKHQTDPWIEKYIFPNSMIPSVQQVGRAIDNLFVLEEWDNFGPHYDRTLMVWYNNFTNHWKEIKANYSEEFFRMWEYYLLCSAGSFRARKNNQWQIILTKK